MSVYLSTPATPNQSPAQRLRFVKEKQVKCATPVRSSFQSVRKADTVLIHYSLLLLTSKIGILLSKNADFLVPANRTRTGTGSLLADFKSAVSTYSTIAAYKNIVSHFSLFVKSAKARRTETASRGLCGFPAVSVFIKCPFQRLFRLENQGKHHDTLHRTQNASESPNGSLGAVIKRNMRQHGRNQHHPAGLPPQPPAMGVGKLPSVLIFCGAQGPDSPQSH